jgi:hypothetical protein
VAYSNQSRILSLAIYPEMTEEMVAHVAEVIESFFEKSETPFGAVPQLVERRHG